jgi:hypothetical protein
MSIKYSHSHLIAMPDAGGIVQPHLDRETEHENQLRRAFFPPLFNQALE